MMYFEMCGHVESITSASIADGKFGLGADCRSQRHSPLMSWIYGFLTVRHLSTRPGAVEVSIAFLVGVRHKSANVSGFGGAGMFLAMLSFFLSTPGWETKPRWFSRALQFT